MGYRKEHIDSRAATALASQGTASAPAAQVAVPRLRRSFALRAHYPLLDPRRAKHCSSGSARGFFIADASLGLQRESPLRGGPTRVAD
jgi:hypothetical protein